MAATSRVPMKVERGIVRPGPLTRPAAMPAGRVRDPGRRVQRERRSGDHSTKRCWRRRHVHERVCMWRKERPDTEQDDAELRYELYDGGEHLHPAGGARAAQIEQHE